MTPHQTSTTDNGVFKRALHRVVVAEINLGDQRAYQRRCLPVGMQDELRYRAERRQTEGREG